MPGGKQTKDSEMENRRTVVAGLVLASLLAVNVSFADEIVVTESLQEAAIDTDEVNRELAAQAHATAVEKAVETVLADIRLDLDIRLIGPTSVTIAAKR